jgi:two-component sensor histidine kinase
MITLQPFVWLICSALLAWHYGYFRPDHTVRTVLILVVYLLVWITKITLTAYWQTWSTLPFLVGGFFVMFIVWAVLVLNTRLARDRATDLSRAVQERTAELEDAVNMQRQLIREVHHSAKSNLQMISSMLQFEQESLSASDMQDSLAQTQRRVHAAARLYESLLSSPEPGAISLELLLLGIIDDLVMTLSLQNLRYNVSVPQESLIPTEFAIKLGLSINEVVYAMLERSQPGGQRQSGSSDVFDAQERDAVLTVSLHIRTSDGLSNSQSKLSERAQIGLEIARGMIESVNGTITESPGSEGNWLFRIPLTAPREQVAVVRAQARPDSQPE